MTVVAFMIGLVVGIALTGLCIGIEVYRAARSLGEHRKNGAASHGICTASATAGSDCTRDTHSSASGGSANGIGSN